MEITTIQQFLEYGTPGVLLLLIHINLYLVITVNNLKATMIDMKSKIVWRDTHEQIEKADALRFQEVERRIERLEDNK